MLPLPVAGSRTCICTIAAPARATSMVACAICAVVIGMAGLDLASPSIPGRVLSLPFTAHVITTFLTISTPVRLDLKVIVAYGLAESRGRIPRESQDRQ